MHSWVEVKLINPHAYKTKPLPSTIRISKDSQPRTDYPGKCRCTQIWRVHPDDALKVRLAIAKEPLDTGRYYVCKHRVVLPKGSDA